MYMPTLKIAESFSVNYFGNCVPKNALYGRLSKFVYIYVNDFSQFLPEEGKTLFSVYILDSRKDSTFHKVLVKKHGLIYKTVFEYIDKLNLYTVKCINVNCVNRASGKPERKEPQTKTGYMYQTYNQNCVDPYCRVCIDTDVTRKFDRYAYIDKK